MIVQLDISAEHEDDFNRAYDNEHVPNLLNVSGVHGCDRYRLEESTDEGHGALRSRVPPRLAGHPGQRRMARMGGQRRRMGVQNPPALHQPHALDIQEDLICINGQASTDRACPREIGGMGRTGYGGLHLADSDGHSGGVGGRLQSLLQYAASVEDN